ncbi:MAG TPA: ROK family protein [Terrimesophilobacter sp.]|uniref:ROK family protein n=1 Tax=Terrimesophilobacter sp. TaxID=2906435 RepID=UPI002F92A3CF
MNISPRARGRNHTEDVHRHNLSAILTLVHRSGGVPRARLTELSGLNRSTVASLVAELVGARLVIEAEPDVRERAGRPSRYVRPSPHPVAIAVNPEVDAITLGVVGLGGNLIRSTRRPVAGAPTVSNIVATIAAMIGELDLAGHRVVGVGAAVPGIVRRQDGVVRLAPHLGWVDAPFAKLLEDATGLTVHVANDASLGASAERLFGAGVDASDLVYLNGGASGIGGGVVVAGNALGGVAGYAGELGHTLVNSTGHACHCGASGCLETEVSQAALLGVLGIADAAELQPALAAATSAAVDAEVARQLDFLAIALRNIINVFNPGRIVLGGFLGILHDADPERLTALVGATALRAPFETVRIMRAALGPDGLMIGAAELAFLPILADPASGWQ